jgi:hypothetical protein|tara:strand:- start:228 stop:416 length:189 start_codon:yes stop_codon:yes gene_type:complete
MSGNRFNRLPVSNATELMQLKNDVNVLSSAIERELLKIDRVVSEEDMVDSNLQLTWFLVDIT